MPHPLHEKWVCTRPLLPLLRRKFLYMYYRCGIHCVYASQQLKYKVKWKYCYLDVQRTSHKITAINPRSSMYTLHVTFHFITAQIFLTILFTVRVHEHVSAT